MAYRVVDCVAQMTTGAGAGDFPLGAAIDGFSTFQAALDVGDCFIYEAHAVDAAGARLADWETGLGQLVSPGGVPSLRRLVILAGSDVQGPPDGEGGFLANVPVAFGPGAKRLSITAVAGQVGGLRLKQQLTFYVRTDGSDANHGMSGNSAEAFASLPHAVAVAQAITEDAVINVGAGVFSYAFASRPGLVSIVGAGAGLTSVSKLEASGGATLFVDNCHISGGYGGAAISSFDPGSSVSFDGVEFSATPYGHIGAFNGGVISAGGYTVSGGCSGAPHIDVGPLSRVVAMGEVTFSDDVTFSGGWVAINQGLALADFSQATFNLGGHTVTGLRYTVRGPGLVDTGGAGENALPGSLPGSLTGGGQYL